MTRTTPMSAVALVLGSCVSLQFGAALATQLFPEVGAWGVTALRLTIAALVLLAVVRPRTRTWSRSQWRSVLVLGVALAGMNGFFYASIARIPLGVAVAIEFLGPLLLAAHLSRRPRDLACVTLAVAAMALIGFESITTATTLDPIGALWAVVAAAFWALYILANARVGESVPGHGGLAVALAVAAACVLPVGAPGAVHALTDPALLLVAAGTALLASVIPYSLELAALRRLPRHIFGVLLSLEPIVAALAGWLLLHQGVGALTLAAIALVVVASIGVTVGDSAQRRRTSADADAPTSIPGGAPTSDTLCR